MNDHPKPLPYKKRRCFYSPEFCDSTETASEFAACKECLVVLDPNEWMTNGFQPAAEILPLRKKPGLGRTSIPTGKESEGVGNRFKSDIH
jgi:hypothetical protein